MPQIFSSADILRFSQQAEDLFTSENDCIIDRYAINVVSGTAEYLLPDYVSSIRRVTYKGRKVYPVSHRNYIDSNISFIAQGAPTDYIFNNIGQGKIKFFPTPNENISAVQLNLFGSEIPNQLIVEFYRLSDYSVNSIPDFMKRRLLKAYVMKMCFSKEGKGQNLKAAKYWGMKWEMLKQIYGELLEELINSPRKLINGSTIEYNDRTPPPPRLPISKFGIGVDV